MKNDIYIPQQDGVAGFVEYGDIEHGTNYAREHEVHVDGVKVIGPCTERAAVAEFLRVNGITSSLRVERVLDSRTPTGRLETLSGLPASMCGPTKVARNALAFVPDWDKKSNLVAAQDLVAGSTELGSNGASSTGRDLGIHDRTE